ncbi:MAG: hypothetical protein AAGB22_02990 [Bacteroidota bacterium]
MHTHADRGQAPHSRAVASRDHVPGATHQTHSAANHQVANVASSSQAAPAQLQRTDDHAGPVQRKAASTPTNGQPVAQLAWTGGLGGAFGLGALGAFFGGPIGALAGTAIGGAAGHYIQDWWNGRNQQQAGFQPLQQVVAHQPAPQLQQPVDSGSFSANLNTRAAFNQELEDHVNLGSNYDAQNQQLTVSADRLNEAAQALDAREAAQRGYVQQALNQQQPLFNNTINNHGNKNVLWQQLLGDVDQGQNSQGQPMSDAVKLKAKTSLARMVGTDEGFDLMSQIQQMSGQMGIPIEYVEDDQGQEFNLTAEPVWNPQQQGHLQSLRVTLPADGRYTDSQAFKRVSNVQNGVTDVQNLGDRLSVSPIDTDVFHEFTHALHYLNFEQRRQQAAQGHQNDQANYDIGLFGTEVLQQNDDVAEARTIHRNQSFTDLSQIVGGMAQAQNAQDPFFERQQAMNGVLNATQNAPSENTFRDAIGLAPRQEHRAMRLQGNGEYRLDGMYPILSQ